MCVNLVVGIDGIGVIILCMRKYNINNNNTMYLLDIPPELLDHIILALALTVPRTELLGLRGVCRKFPLLDRVYTNRVAEM